MQTRIAFVGPSALLAAALVLTSCTAPLGPDRNTFAAPTPPLFGVAPPVSNGLVLDQWNGSLNEQSVNPAVCDGNNPCLIKGFNPQNPHVGDAIVATFFWTGGTNVVASVTDHLTNLEHTPVGNTYTLVSYVTDGSFSMATYVATNVQNFPDATIDQSQILAVRANLSTPVNDGGVIMAAYSGLPVTVGAASSGNGAGTTPVLAAPGSVSVAAGGLSYGVTMSGTLVGTDPPAAPFQYLVGASDNFMKVEARHAFLPNASIVNPQWTWYFDPTQPGSWLASQVALNPKATRVVFTAQPSTTLPLMTITPSVQATVVDDLGNAMPNFTGSATVAIGKNGGLLVPGTLSGTKTVAFVNGVATFSNLSIDQAGNGYTLVVTAPGLRSGESNAFNIGVM